MVFRIVTLRTWLSYYSVQSTSREITCRLTSGLDHAPNCIVGSRKRINDYSVARNPMCRVLGSRPSYIVSYFFCIPYHRTLVDDSDCKVKIMALLLLVYFLLPLLPHLILSSPPTPLSLNPRNFASSNSTSASDSLRASPVNCNAARFGANLRLRSIRNALAKIPNDRSLITFEMRQSGLVPGWYTQLPHRIISGELYS